MFAGSWTLFAMLAFAANPVLCRLAPVGGAGGIGYAIWYSALPYLCATGAAMVQLNCSRYSRGRWRSAVGRTG